MPCTAHTLPAFSPHPGSSTVPADVEPVFKHTLLAGHSFSPFCYAFVQMFSTLPRPGIPMPIPMTFPMLHSIDYDQSSADSLIPIMIHDRRRSFKSNLISQLTSQVQPSNSPSSSRSPYFLMRPTPHIHTTKHPRTENTMRGASL